MRVVQSNERDSLQSPTIAVSSRAVIYGLYVTYASYKLIIYPLYASHMSNCWRLDIWSLSNIHIEYTGHI